jgi:uncharacterized delta-60 repeat protein
MTTGPKRTRRRRIGSAVATTGLVLALATLAPAATSAAGDLDVQFDQDGIVLTGSETGGSTFADFASAVLRQPDGKLVAAGTRAITGGASRIAVVRTTTAGALDSSFGTGGRVEPELGAGIDSSARGVARQSSGKLVVTGRFELNGDRRFGVLRLTSTGSRDSTFAVGGLRLTQAAQVSGETAEGLAVQGDDRVVVAGHGCLEPCSTVVNAFVVARYTADGAPDTSFGAALANGIVYTSFTGGARAFDVVVQSDGRIVVVGASGAGSGQVAVARYRTNGTLDTSFSGDGKALTNFTSTIGEEAVAVAIQSNGRIVVAGRANAGTLAAPRNRIALVRYRTDGTLDTSFDGDGKVLTSFAGDDAEATAIAIQPDGKIVVAGRARNGSTTRPALVRYTTNGSLDTSFDGDGKVLTIVPSSSTAVANALTLQPDGKLVAAGSAAISGRGTELLLARHEG